MNLLRLEQNAEKAGSFETVMRREQKRLQLVTDIALENRLSWGVEASKQVEDVYPLYAEEIHERILKYIDDLEILRTERQKQEKRSQ